MPSMGAVAWFGRAVGRDRGAVAPRAAVGARRPIIVHPPAAVDAGRPGRVSSDGPGAGRAPPSPPFSPDGVAMRFTKMHGLGNDYVYVSLFDQPAPRDLAATARA